MVITDERKKFLMSIFTPTSPPRIPAFQVKDALEMFHSFESLEERIKYFDQMTLEDKFKIFQHLNTHAQVELLIHCNTDDADILALCNSLGAGERFVLQIALKRRGVL